MTTTPQVPQTYHRPQLTEEQLQVISQLLAPEVATNYQAALAKATIDKMLLRIHTRRLQYGSAVPSGVQVAKPVNSGEASKPLPSEVTPEMGANLMALIKKQVELDVDDLE